MDIVQITPGAGGMYCGNCFRDNALVAALHKAGHTALLVPLYLPLTLDEEDQSHGKPIFFGGVSVYLEQLLPLFRYAPQWLHRWLASPWLLQKLAARAANTHPSKLGPITISMIQGEDGRQACELTELVGWLKERPRADVICLSNVLLVGMVREMKKQLGLPVVCMLQGEDYFLNALLQPYRDQAWSMLAERAREVDLFVAPSRYFADLMAQRLELDPDRVMVVHNGINLEGYMPSPGKETSPSDEAPVLGYFARMCTEKGLDLLVEAFIRLRRRNRVPHLRLKVGGGCGPSDLPVVHSLQAKLRSEGLSDVVSFHPNLDRAGKIEFLHSLSVFSVPATYGEAFGLYLIEAMAAGIPVVQPDTASFSELVTLTGGGLLCAAGDPEALSVTIEELLLDPVRRRRLGDAGREHVQDSFSVEHMRDSMLAAYGKVLDHTHRPTQAPQPNR